MVRPAVSDTSPAAEEVQLRLLREASPARRVQLALSLSQTCAELARAALRRRWPDASEREIRLRFAEVHYGEDLAERVRRHLARLDRES